MQSTNAAAVPRRAGLSEARQRLPAAVRRSQLLEVALARFGPNGFHGTSMEEIAEAAGVTKPVLYQHFGSKRSLYLELLETVGEELLGEVTERVGAEADPYRRVLAGFQAYFRFVCERTNSFRLLFGSGARKTDEFAEAIGSWETRVAASIASLIEADIEADHRDLLGYAIVGLGEVAARAWVSRHLADRSTLTPQEAEVLAVRLADLVWAGLRALPTDPRRAGGASP
jgi:AcrR family transcriptional regulator